MTRIAIYARVSTTDQSCDMQLGELRRYAQSRGFQIVDEYVDTGISGTKSSRPERNRLMNDARLRRFDEVLTWKLDRWGRSIVDTMATLQELAGIGVAFLAVTQNIGTEESNPMAKFMVQIMAAFAELERAMINERIVSGVKRAQEKGTKSGKPFGRPKLVFRRDRVQELRGAGKSWSQVAAELGVTVAAARRALQETIPLEMPDSAVRS